MNQLNSVIDNFKNLKVLVIGDAILDNYIKGNIDRICREAPVPVFNTLEKQHQCGGAANTAINVATLGAETFFLSVIGKDTEGKQLLTILKNNKVHSEFIVQDKSRTTISKNRITASSTILLRVDEGTIEPIQPSLETQIKERFSSLYPFVDAVIISDYGYGILTEDVIQSVHSVICKDRKPLIIDAKDLKRFALLTPTAIKPNYEEALYLLGLQKVARSNRINQVLANSSRIFDLTNAEKAIVTLDTEGVILLEKEKKPYIVKCTPVDNKNTIGAGDTFVSALTLSLASRLKAELSTEIAATAAAVVVKKDGTVGCTNNELKAQFNSIPKYILSDTDLVKIVADLKKEGKKIIFTNGCFDILHKGHVTLLNKARDLGDVLIVGVNSDASIRKLKGNDRPINNLEDRITVLAGLQSIDYLIAFEEESPVRLIKSVHPNVFVKGGDYNEKSIPEASLIKKLGGKIEIIPYVQDHSTTGLINRIKDINEVLEAHTEGSNYV